MEGAKLKKKINLTKNFKGATTSLHLLEDPPLNMGHDEIQWRSFELKKGHFDTVLITFLFLKKVVLALEKAVLVLH